MATTDNLFRNYYIFYILCGVCPINTFIIFRRNSLEFLSNMPLFVHLINVIIYLYLLYRDALNLDLDLKLSLWNTLFRGTLSVFPNIVFIFEVLINGKNCFNILTELNRVNIYLQQFINIHVKLKHLKRSIHLKFICGVVLIEILRLILVFTHSFKEPITFYAPLLLIVEMCKLTAMHFVVCLIEYMNFLIYSLNQQLINVRCDEFGSDNNVWDLINLLRRIRTMHFKLHNVAIEVNSRFGWFLVAIPIHLFGLINSNAFLSFTSFAEGFNMLRLFRNFIWLFFYLKLFVHKLHHYRVPCVI